MKLTKHLFIVFFLPLLCVTTFAQTPRDEHRRQEALHFEKLRSGNNSVLVSSRNIDVTYYNLQTRMLKMDAGFSGSTYLEYKSLSANLTTVVLDYYAAGTIDSVIIAGKKLSAGNFVHAGDTVLITLPAPLALNAASSMTVYYRGPYNGSAFMVKTVDNVELGEQTISVSTQAEPYDGRKWWKAESNTTERTSSRVCRKSSSVSPGKPMIKSDVREMSGRTARKSAIFCTNCSMV